MFLCPPPTIALLVPLLVVASTRFSKTITVSAFAASAVRATDHRRILLLQQRRRMASSCNNEELTSGLTDIGTGGNDNERMMRDATTSTTTPWQERIQGSIARTRKIRGSNFVQLATVDPITHEPRCRTVVFRGFYGGTISTLKMITDQRSNKVQEARTSTSSSSNNNTAELVWWFPKSNEQYRIRGSLEFVGGSSSTDDDEVSRAKRIERKQMWGNLRDPAREQFYWDAPGLPLPDTPTTTVPLGGRDGNGKVLEPPATFLLMLLHPTRVDYLRLGDNYRQIDCIEEDEDEKNNAASSSSWTQQAVTP